MTNQANAQAAQNDALRRELELVRRQRQAENDRLLQQIQQQQDSSRRDRAQMNATIRELDNQVKERERLQRERIQAMQRQHESQISRLENEFQAERQGLQAEIRQTRSEMQRNISQLRTETDQKLQRQREENQRSLNQMSAKLEGQISAVDQKVNSLAQQIAAREQGDRELAEYWAQEAARMISQIRETFREQLLDQKRISILERRIRQANDDIKGGQYQSAITAGREAFFDALDMKEDLAAAELEWNYWFNALKTREGQLLQELESAENRVYEIDTDEGPIEYRNGIDYWTFGQFTILRNQISKLRSSLSDVESMTMAQLQNTEEQLRALQEQLALVENAAHINVAMSVSRYETAAKIGNILDSNYEMIDADGEFFGREDREEYHAIFQNPITGDQVAVVITPIPDEAGVVTNHIELIVGNADNNPVTRDRIAREVAEKLRSSGVEGCSFPCASRFGDGTAQEVARVGNIAAVESGDEKVRATLPNGNGRTDTSMSRVRRRTQES
jgi:hypothetical protein